MLRYPNERHPSLPPDGHPSCSDFTYSGVLADGSPSSVGITLNLPVEDVEDHPVLGHRPSITEKETTGSLSAEQLLQLTMINSGQYLPHFTGFRKGATPIALDAPTQRRTSLAPSLTSTHHISPATSSTSSAKRPVEDDACSSKSPLSAVGRLSPARASPNDDNPYEDLDPDATAEGRLEKRRRKNTVAARRSRARKAGYVQDLEEEVQALRERLLARDQELLHAREELEALRMTSIHGQ